MSLSGFKEFIESGQYWLLTGQFKEEGLKNNVYYSDVRMSAKASEINGVSIMHQENKEGNLIKNIRRAVPEADIKSRNK